MAINLTNPLEDIATQRLNEEIDSLRDNLLALGGFSPSHPFSSKRDPVTEEFYLKNKALGLLFIGVEQVQKSKADKKTEDQQTEIDIHRKEVVTTLVKSQESLDFEIKEFYKPVNVEANQGAVSTSIVSPPEDSPDRSQHDSVYRAQTEAASNKATSTFEIFQKNENEGYGTTNLETIDPDKSNTDFEHKPNFEIHREPNEAFVKKNSHKLFKFKDLTATKDAKGNIIVPGLENTDQLKARNQVEGEAVAKSHKESNTNSFTNSSLAGTSTPPLPGAPVAGHSDVGVSRQTVFKIAGTASQPPQKIFKSWAPDPTRFGETTHATDNKQYFEKVNEILGAKQPSGSYKFFIEKLHGRKTDGTPYVKNPISKRSDKQKTADELPNRMVFPAYVAAFNDSYDVSWSEYNFIGRGEKVYAWDNTTRSLTLEFYIISDFSADMLIQSANALQAVQQKGKQTNVLTDLVKKIPNPLEKSSLVKSSTKKALSFGEDFSSVVDRNLGGASAHIPPQIRDISGNLFKPKEQPLTPHDKLADLLALLPDWGTGAVKDATRGPNGRLGFIHGELSGTPEQLWERVTFLTQCVYGWYRKDGKLKEQPFVRIRIADFFDVIAKINSLNFTQDEFDVDFNPSALGNIPMAVRVAINATIIHEDEPSSEYRRFYHREDFDVDAFDAPGGREGSKTKDSILDDALVKSPAFFKTNSIPQGATEFPADATAIQEGLKDLHSSLKDLRSSASTLNDGSKKERLKKALKVAKRLSDIKSKIEAGLVKDKGSSEASSDFTFE